MPADGDLTNPASEIVEIYTWVGEEFGVLIDDGPSCPKCKVAHIFHDQNEISIIHFSLQ